MPEIHDRPSAAPGVALPVNKIEDLDRTSVLKIKIKTGWGFPEPVQTVTTLPVRKGRAMAYRDSASDSFWAELGGIPDPAAPAPETLPSRDLTCFVCGQPGHFAVACRLHPARLRKLRGEACGPGPCSAACRAGDHNDCSPHWCTCPCHEIAL